MSESLDRQKAALLDLIGPARTLPEWGALDVGDWQAIAAMAQQHRLEPWLHHRLRTAGSEWPVPADRAGRWKDAYRTASFCVLTAQAALVRLARAFGDADVPMVALKGARLAFFDYPEAALRPMRDIDLLVTPDDLPRALDAMEQAGCDVPADRERAIARALDGDKHLDPILLPDCQRYVELHHRIAEPGLPCIDTAAILASAKVEILAGAPIAFPGDAEMLGHQVLHAAYNHRFDCGPLALVDIAQMLTRSPIDAARFAAMANDGGWLAGARLVLALVDKVMGTTGLDIGQDQVPPEVLAEGERLLLQDFDQRAQVLLSSQTARDGVFPTLAARLKGGIKREHDEGFARWFISRAMRTVRQGSDARARSEAASGAIVARWLGQP
ncbi:nucleotidyltransferase family protein [Croceicoccus gelatinilyticus]|uniref:nucleotidyltransferase domain-containing protein n=1 Tax=Croceicoccus gelatinilyticus TaxID=2835536 RepID=UPI001BD06557|nr:nucleotidyltransferase family protein [Croceicoccus gelatinilyticus]MBS7669496.1 nucleotidyltransferase family protein [Croceicoccus gelatinilyticus]